MSVGDSGGEEGTNRWHRCCHPHPTFSLQCCCSPSSSTSRPGAELHGLEDCWGPACRGSGEGAPGAGLGHRGRARPLAGGGGGAQRRSGPGSGSWGCGGGPGAAPAEPGACRRLARPLPPPPLRMPLRCGRARGRPAPREGLPLSFKKNPHTYTN